MLSKKPKAVQKNNFHLMSSFKMNSYDFYIKIIYYIFFLQNFKLLKLHFLINVVNFRIF